MRRRNAAELIEEIRRDRKSGATALAGVALEAFSLSKRSAAARIQAREQRRGGFAVATEELKRVDRRPF